MYRKLREMLGRDRLQPHLWTSLLVTSRLEISELELEWCIKPKAEYINLKQSSWLTLIMETWESVHRIELQYGISMLIQIVLKGGLKGIIRRTEIAYGKKRH